MSVFGKSHTERMRGRPRTGRCKHPSPVLAEQVDDGVLCRCLICNTTGPVRKSSEKARQALQGISAS